MRRWIVILACLTWLGACACKSNKGTGPGTGSGADCAAIEPHVHDLYKAEATAGGSGENVDEEVADNVTMVMNDCAASPDKVAPCATGAKTVAELESKCLLPLDDEGSEGDKFK